MNKLLVLSLASMVFLAAENTLAQGNADKGATYYNICATCHGADAEGNPDTKAPRLAGQYEWYLIQQLKNFRAGIRGTDPKDLNGAVMKPMADTLPDDQAVEDVVAYIMTKNPRRYRYKP
ncbi:MAG: c-type cytochrome [Pseudomonadales bacterium]|nr:c-type cytochrome [Pseudomonadales bacterium]